jgi:hypothetical protein
MSELVVILKGGNKQRNVIGAVLADKAAPPFAERRDGYRLRWWGTDHPASEKIRILAGADDGGQEPGGDGQGQMRTGWMWFDNDKGRTLEQKVERAAERVRAKHGRWPDMCYVNSRAAPGGNFVCGKVRVVAAPNILPHHFWLGPLEKAA